MNQEDKLTALDRLRSAFIQARAIRFRKNKTMNIEQEVTDEIEKMFGGRPAKQAAMLSYVECEKDRHNVSDKATTVKRIRVTTMWKLEALAGIIGSRSLSDTIDYLIDNQLNTGDSRIECLFDLATELELKSAGIAADLRATAVAMETDAKERADLQSQPLPGKVESPTGKDGKA